MNPLDNDFGLDFEARLTDNITEKNVKWALTTTLPVDEQQIERTARLEFVLLNLRDEQQVFGLV